MARGWLLCFAALSSAIPACLPTIPGPEAFHCSMGGPCDASLLTDATLDAGPSLDAEPDADTGLGVDAEPDSGLHPDAQTLLDAEPARDADATADAEPLDAVVFTDATPGTDADTADAAVDAGDATVDAGDATVDAGDATADAGVTDSGPDAAMSDAAASDAGLPIGDLCGSDLECQSHYCSDFEVPRRCTLACRLSSECPSGSACQWDNGLRLCRPDAVHVDPVGTSCSGAVNSCQSGVCRSGTCASGCGADADCAPLYCTEPNAQEGDLMSVTTACGPRVGTREEACNNDADCIHGICNLADHLCTAPCCKGTGGECSGRAPVCRPATLINGATVTICSGTIGTRLLGASCSTDSECATGFCLARASQPAQRICTTTCCSNADCTGFTAGLCRAQAITGGQTNLCVPQ